MLGRNIILNSKPYTVIGVISTRFGWWAPDVWLPGRFERMAGARHPKLRFVTTTKACGSSVVTFLVGLRSIHYTYATDPCQDDHEH